MALKSVSFSLAFILPTNSSTVFSSWQNKLAQMSPKLATMLPSVW